MSRDSRSRSRRHGALACGSSMVVWWRKRERHVILRVSSDDGRVAAHAGYDGWSRQWDIQGETTIDEIVRRIAYALTQDQCRRNGGMHQFRLQQFVRSPTADFVRDKLRQLLAPPM